MNRAGTFLVAALAAGPAALPARAMDAAPSAQAKAPGVTAQRLDFKAGGTGHPATVTLYRNPNALVFVVIDSIGGAPDYRLSIGGAAYYESGMLHDAKMDGATAQAKRLSAPGVYVPLLRGETLSLSLPAQSAFHLTGYVMVVTDPATTANGLPL